MRSPLAAAAVATVCALSYTPAFGAAVIEDKPAMHRAAALRDLPIAQIIFK